MAKPKPHREFNIMNLRMCPQIFPELPPVLIFSDGNGYIFFAPPDDIMQPALKVCCFIARSLFKITSFFTSLCFYFRLLVNAQQLLELLLKVEDLRLRRRLKMDIGLCLFFYI